MRILGIDPGARNTGLVVIDEPPITRAKPAGTIDLLSSFTVTRPKVDGEDLLHVPPAYLVDVAAVASGMIREHDVDLIAVERVKRPSWRVGGKVKPLDPTGIMATSIVFGAIMGRAWPVPVVAVAVGSNGTLLRLDAYPGPLATTGKGSDRRRHERSAYDVALRGRSSHRLAQNGYAP